MTTATEPRAHMPNLESARQFAAEQPTTAGVAPLFRQNSPPNLAWLTYESRFEDDRRSIYVNADEYEVSVSVAYRDGVMNYRLSPDLADAFAAELVAGAKAVRRA